MKKVLVVLFALVSVCGRTQVVVLLNENFDNGFPTGWQRIDMDGLTPNAAVSYVGNSFGIIEDYDSTGTGDSIAAATSWFNPVGQADNYLITPQVQLKSNGNQLFYEVKSQDPSYPDGYQVLISTTLPVVDSFHVHDTLFFTDAELPGWTERVIDLDSFVNQNIYIAFHHVGNDKFVLCFDNIRVIADTTLSVSEKADEIFISVYPNPVSDELIFSSSREMKNVIISVFDLTGKIYWERSVNGKSVRIPVAGLADGMYLVRAVYPDGRMVNKKFLKTK